MAQEPVNYTTKNGLPSNNVYDIQQDANGFMWFATNRGLVKFNGETFKTFTRKDGLPNNDIWLLEADAKGRIYYATKSKYQGYIKNDSVYKFLTPDASVVSPRFYKNRNKIWWYCEAGYLTIKNNKLINEIDLVERDKIISLAKEEYKVNIINLFHNPKNKESYIIDKNFIALDSAKNYLYNFPIKNSNWSNLKNRGRVSYSRLLPNDTFYVGKEFGLFFYNFKSKKIKTFDFKTLINKETVLNISSIKTTEDEIQISIPNYLFVFNYEFDLIRKHKFKNQIENSKNYQDSNGNIWQSSLENGVTLKPNSNLNNTIFKNSKVQKLQLINNLLYVGISHDGFYEYNILDNTSKKISSISSDALVSGIKQKPKTDYFISSVESYKNINKKVYLSNDDLKLQDQLKKIDRFKDIENYEESEYFITSVALLRSPKDSKTAFLEIRKSGLEKMLVFKDTLFIAGSDGLHVFDRKNKLYKPAITNEFLDISISCFTKNGTHLIVGTDGRGVYYYNTNELIPLKHTDGLIIQEIIEKDDALWLATDVGVKKVSLDKKNLANSKITDAFYEADGLLQNNTNDIYVKDSLLLVASDIGLAKINLNNKFYKQLPKLYFKTEKDTLHFENNERDNITVSFSTLDFVNQEHLKYQYRLLPQQNYWTATSTKTLSFSNLAPKLYTLEVKVTDQHNNKSIAKQYLNVIPAWWQTTLAKFGIAFIVLFGFLFFVKILKQRIQQKEHAKSAIDKKVAGLELQALRSQMNPHFVHNSLNAIQYFIQRNEVDLSEEYLSKFSYLIRLFFDYSRRQTVKIEEELELLTYYLDIEKLRFEERLNFNIIICKEIDTKEQYMPSMLLQPIVENAVNHGIFHKEDKEVGNILIEFKDCIYPSFKVTIIDDGIGINKSQELFSYSVKNYQSNSSEVLKERLFLLNRSKEWEINYNIEDHSVLDKNKTGTIVTLSFTPLIKL